MNPALLGIVFVLGSSKVGGNADWSQFRGPRGDGVAAAARVPRAWSEGEHVAWKIAPPGTGWSSPLVMGELVLLTTAVADELGLPLTYQKGVDAPDTSKEPPPDVEIEWRVLAYDLASGALRWSASAGKAKPRFPIHPSNTHASETPAADEHGVYAYFGSTGTVAAFDLAGKPLWRAELGAHPTKDAFGTGTSPVLFERRLFVQVYSEDAGFLVCLDARDGKELWRVTRASGTAWNTPCLWRTAARTELVTAAKKRIASYDPASGKELWHADGLDVPDSSSCTAAGERLYFGFRGQGVNGPLRAWKAGASGDLALKEGTVACEAWAASGAAPGMPSPVVANGCVFTLAGGFVQCVDVATGAVKFKERLEGTGVVAASPLAVGDALLVIGETGKAVLVKAAPSFELLGGGQLDDMFWATPAVAGNALLLRDVQHLYCVR